MTLFLFGVALGTALAGKPDAAPYFLIAGFLVSIQKAAAEEKHNGR